jgi:hypothetical protein
MEDKPTDANQDEISLGYVTSQGQEISPGTLNAVIDTVTLQMNHDVNDNNNMNQSSILDDETTETYQSVDGAATPCSEAICPSGSIDLTPFSEDYSTAVDTPTTKNSGKKDDGAVADVTSIVDNEEQKQSAIEPTNLLRNEQYVADDVENNDATIAVLHDNVGDAKDDDVDNATIPLLTIDNQNATDDYSMVSTVDANDEERHFLEEVLSDNDALSTEEESDVQSDVEDKTKWSYHDVDETTPIFFEKNPANKVILQLAIDEINNVTKRLFAKINKEEEFLSQVG